MLLNLFSFNMESFIYNLKYHVNLKVITMLNSTLVSPKVIRDASSDFLLFLTYKKKQAQIEQNLQCPQHTIQVYTDKLF